MFYKFLRVSKRLPHLDLIILHPHLTLSIGSEASREPTYREPILPQANEHKRVLSSHGIS